MIPNPDNSGISYRLINFLGLALSGGGLALTVLYLQTPQDAPCPLCTLIRVILLILAALFLIGWLFNPRTLIQRLLGSLNLVLVLGGLAASFRRVWLHAVGSLQPCEPSAGLLTQTGTPLQKLIDAFRGTGECIGNSGQLLGLQSQHLSLILFVLLLLVVWRQLRKRVRRSYFT